VLAVALVARGFRLVAAGMRWSGITAGAFFVALLIHAAVTGHWVRLFRGSSRR